MQWNRIPLPFMEVWIPSFEAMDLSYFSSYIFSPDYGLYTFMSTSRKIWIDVNIAPSQH